MTSVWRDGLTASPPNRAGKRVSILLADAGCSSTAAAAHVNTTTSFLV
jgi:hypothetical protein